jgi:hypothetical protein
VNAVASASSPSVEPVAPASTTATTSPDTKPKSTAPEPTIAPPTSSSTVKAATPPASNAATSTTAHDQLAHLYAIREQLSAKERAIAEHAIAHMDAATHAHWLAELSSMSIEEATTMIRTMIEQLPQPPR